MTKNQHPPPLLSTLPLFLILFAQVLHGFAKKKIKSHAFCLSVCIGKSNFECPTWKYPVYELLYRSVPSPFFQNIQCNVHTLHQILLREKKLFSWQEGRGAEARKNKLEKLQTNHLEFRQHLVPALCGFHLLFFWFLSYVCFSAGNTSLNYQYSPTYMIFAYLCNLVFSRSQNARNRPFNLQPLF